MRIIDSSAWSFWNGTCMLHSLCIMVCQMHLGTWHLDIEHGRLNPFPRSFSGRGLHWIINRDTHFKSIILTDWAIEALDICYAPARHGHVDGYANQIWSCTLIVQPRTYSVLFRNPLGFLLNSLIRLLRGYPTMVWQCVQPYTGLLWNAELLRQRLLSRNRLHLLGSFCRCDPHCIWALCLVAFPTEKVECQISLQ